MFNKATLNPGSYFIGDVVYYLKAEDLRDILYEIVFHEKLINEGLKPIISSRKLVHCNVLKDFKEVWDNYWLINTKCKEGTYFDQNKKSYGFNFGVFGVIPIEWCFPKVESNFITFENKFDLYSTNDKIIVGDMIFTQNNI